jgi:Ca-activated chloride channel family protein
MEDFFNRISHPAMTDLKLDWGGLNVTEVFPSALPDLFVGRSVIVTGRFAGTEESNIRINGMAAGQPVQVSVPAPLGSAAAADNSIPAVWARMKMAELADQSTYLTDSELPEAIKHVALDYGLMSPFTAFVAVDSTHRTEGSEGTTVPVAVPVPEGVKYKTTVDDN